MSLIPARRPAATAVLWGGLALAALGVFAGCENLNDFAGGWRGTVVGDSSLRQGFAASDSVEVQIATVTTLDVDATVTLPGHAAPVRFEIVRRAQGDALGHLQLSPQALRTYVGYLRPQGDAPYIAFLSLFPEDRVQLRVLRGPDEFYGVFHLVRAP